MKRASSLLRILNILTLVGMTTIAILGLVNLFVPGLDEATGSILLTVGLGVVTLNVVAMLFLRSKSEQETVRKININNFENKLVELEKQKAGILTYQKNGRIIHLTDWLVSAGFKNVLGKFLDVLEVDFEKSNEHEVKRDNRTFKLSNDSKRGVVFVEDVTEFAKFREVIVAKQHAVFVLDIQYSDQLKFNNSEFTKTQGMINKIIDSFARKVGGTVSTLNNSDEMIISSEWGSLASWFGTEKNNFYKQFKKIGDNRKGIIITGGVATANKSIFELTELARIGLRTASNKGGNLIFVDLGENTKVIGSSTIGFTEKTSVEMNFFRKTIDEKIKNARNVFITTHAYADADALASVIGMYEYVKKLKKKSNIVIDTSDKTSSIIFDKYGEEYSKNKISASSVDEKINKNTVLIVTDTADTMRTQLSKETIDKFAPENIIVIDHHRASDSQLPANIDSMFLDTNKSSASEIVTELLMNQSDGSENAISQNVATMLFLGGYIDTNGWMKNTGSGTHAMASYLIKSGADHSVATSYIQIPKKLIEQFKILFENTVFYKDQYAFAELPRDMTFEDEVISIFANKLLEFDGTNASFVIGKNKNKRIKVSARSNESVNVQSIMTKIGGGGHFDMAAASFPTTRRSQTIVGNIKFAIDNNGN